MTVASDALALEPKSMMIAFTVGFLLGVGYFYGLWMTSRAAVRVNRPVWLLAGSFVVRMGVLLAGLMWVTRGRFANVALAVLALMLGRQVVMKITSFGDDGEASV